MASQFEKLGLLPQFVQAVEKLGFETPTPIQMSAIPALLSGRNVVGQAQTGTGKTAAYALPMLQGIEVGKKVVQALVLTPTRELAIQVAEATRNMASTSPLRAMAVYGGQAYYIQVRQLQQGVDVVVGTPGRLLDLIRQKLLDLSQVRYLVLDEADEMLEMGFIDDVETILAQVPAERQIALFSATLPNAVRKLADRYVSNPQEIRINPSHITVAETEQRYCRVREDDKLAALTRLLEVEEVTSALIFTRTKARAQDLSDELIRRGYPAASLHGDLNQTRREYVLNRFRQRTITLLVATDVAARGLDIEGMSHVFNYDVPADPDDYVHRIGRTGRAGRKGVAITFLTPRERGHLKVIESFTRQVMIDCPIPSRNDIIGRRDDRFLQRLTEQLGAGSISHERALIAKLSETSFDLMEIAAAAIRLARAGEPELAIDEIVAVPAPEVRAARGKGRNNREATRDHAREYDSLRAMAVSMDPGKGSKKTSRTPARAWSGEAEPQPRGNKHSQESGMVRLRMNLGNANGIRPGDVVGAIAGEVGIPGRAIGEIDIRKDYTLVDVMEQHVRQVLQQSTGQYQLRGKPVLLTLAN
ncbi:MAG TPA: DEAD/DEAH box helicase [Anaerolineaceae bacterium]